MGIMGGTFCQNMGNMGGIFKTFLNPVHLAVESTKLLTILPILGSNVRKLMKNSLKVGKLPSFFHFEAHQLCLPSCYDLPK